MVMCLVLPVVVGWGSRSGTLGPATRLSALDALHYLSPVAALDASVWYGVRPDVGWPQALFLLGLTCLALGGLALLRGERVRAAWSALLAGGALGVVAVAILLAVSPPSAVLLGASRTTNVSFPLLTRYDRLIPYTPVCAGAPVPVCVHPAYQSYLAAEAPVINRLIAPLVGLPGVPLRAAQLPHGEMGVIGRVLAFLPNNGNNATDQYFFGNIAQALVGYDVVGPLPPCPGDPTLRACMEAQDAIGIWLVRQAGLRLDIVNAGGTTLQPYFGGVDWDATSAAATRFASLGRERQRAWLRAHYITLRHGGVPLKDLP